MATRREAAWRKVEAKVEAEPKAKRKPKATGKPRAKRRPAQQQVLACVPADETPQQAITHIAHDAVLILRRGLAWRAALAERLPSRISMTDCIALLRLTADLGEAARKGESGDAQPDYSRLSPDERVQLAQLLLKVDYA